MSVWKESKSNDWQEINSHSEHMGSVNCIGFACWEMGLKLASGGSDGVVVVLSKRGDDTWDKPYKFEAHQQGINQLVWAPFTHTTTFYKHTQRPLQ